MTPSEKEIFSSPEDLSKAEMPLTALSQKLEVLNDLFAESSVYFWVLNEKHEFVYANKSASKAFQRFYSFQWNKGEAFGNLFIHDQNHNSSVWLANYEKTLNSKEITVFEVTESSDSGFSHIRAEIHPVLENDIVVGTYCIVNDESERFLKNKLQIALSSFKSKLLHTFTVSDLLWCITDEVLAHLYLEDAIILMRNKDLLQSETAFGSKRIGDKKIDGLLEIPAHLGIVGQVATTGEAVIVNDTSTSDKYFKDHFDAGSEIAVPIKLDGKAIGVINCESSHKNFFRPLHLEILTEVAEVTAERIDQIRTEEKYRKVRELNHAVLNSTPNGYLLLNLNQEILSFNRTASVAIRLFRSSELKLGESIVNYFPEEFHSEFTCLFESSMSGKLNKLEKEIKHSKSGNLWFRATFAPAYNKEGEIFGVTLIIEDITKDKQSEQLIVEQNQRLTKTNEELDKFIYSVSHDLRSPVSSVMGITTLIDLTDSVEEIKQYNKLISGSMQRMDDFIRNILDYSRNARLHVHVEEVDFKELIKDIVIDHSYMREKGEIKVIQNISCTHLTSDRQRLSIVMSNLLSNAIKYHDPNKEEQFIEISSNCNGNYFCILVKDNGLGIKQEHQKSLFEMFYTVDSKSDKGSGIGLYILSDTVKILGGEIKLTSEYGVGTEFEIRLPLVLESK